MLNISPEPLCEWVAGSSGWHHPRQHRHRQLHGLSRTCSRFLTRHSSCWTSSRSTYWHIQQQAAGRAPLFSTYGSVPPLRWRIHACGSSRFARYFAGRTGAGGLQKRSRASSAGGSAAEHAREMLQDRLWPAAAAALQSRSSNTQRLHCVIYMNGSKLGNVQRRLASAHHATPAGNS